MYDKRGREDEIDAEQVEISKPRKSRFGPAEKQKGRDAFLRTLTSGREVGETWSERELKIAYIKEPNSNKSGNKRSREEPTEEADGEWHYTEELSEDDADIDARAADVGSGQMDEEQDI